MMKALFELLKTLTRRLFNERKRARKRIAEETKKAGGHYKAGLTTKEEAVTASQDARMGNIRPSIEDRFKTEQTTEAIAAHKRGQVLPRARRRTRQEALELARKK